MAESSWPSPTHNSRAVNDLEYEQLLAAYAGDGLVGSATDADLVYADSTGMQVKVRANRFGLVRGQLWSSGPTDITKTIAANASGQTRIDLAVLRRDRSTWATTVQIKAGTPGGPAPATENDLGTTGLFEIPISEITVPNLASTMANSDLDNRGWYLTPGGGISCTSTSRPPHWPGRRIYEVDTGVRYVSSGSAWLLDGQDSGRIAITSPSGWSGGGHVRKANGWVELSLAASRTGSTVPASGISQLATLPSDFQPADQVELVFYLGGGNIGHGYVTTLGGVFIDDFWVNITSGTTVIAHQATWYVG
jgi:hypothetical protein